MNFIQPKYEELYNKLSNNNKLRNFLIKNRALVTVEDFYSNYGIDDKSKMEVYVKQNNEQVYKNLTELLLPEQDYIKEKTIDFLVASGYNKEEIKYACGFSTDTILNYDFYWEIFFTCKYCYTESFFQNNWEKFIPECDFEEMEKNESAYAFMDAIMKEFDHLDYILKNTKKFKDYKEIPFEYINYLSQLLGVEQKTFMMDSDMAAQYRVLAENILDVYKQRGTDASWELLFNFLGFNVTVEEYYFDRRRLFTSNGMNLEMNSTNINDYRYYLTTIDPRENYLEQLATNEIVTDIDFSEIKNLRNFNHLVEKYGLMCVLGYDDSYIYTKTKRNYETDYEEKGAEALGIYTGDVYKYFKTNYLRIKPSLKFESGNFTMDQLYQLGCLLNFLTPEFIQREMYTIIDTGKDSEKIIINYSRDEENDNFYILDSEDWDQSYSQKYLINYDSYKNNSSASYSSVPKVIDDLGNERIYINSLGENQHFANNRFYNVFFNPLSEKIKLINSTKYWGDKIKIKDATGKIYPVWRTDMNYKFGGITHKIDSDLKEKGEQLQTLYLPQHASLLPPNWVKKNWDNIESIDLNGFENKSIRRFIKDMNNSVTIRWKTDLPIEKFLKEDISEEELKTFSKEELETRSKFFEKKWKNVSNYTWKIYGSPLTKEKLKIFIDTHDNIINYDYLKKELFANNDFTNLGFKENSKYEIKNYNSSIGTERIQNNRLSENILNALDGNDCFFISGNKNFSTFYVYKAVYKNKYQKYDIYKFRPEPDNRIESTKFVYPTYNSLLKSISDDGKTFTYDKTKEIVKINSSSSVNFYVTADKEYYKPILDTTGNKIIIHSKNIGVNPVSIFLPLQDSKKIKEENILGSFYYYNAFKNDEEERKIDETYLELKERRHPQLMQYKYANIYKNDLIYSTYDQKLYIILFNGVISFNTNSTNVTFEYGSKNSIKSYNNCFGVKEVNFYGKLKLDNDGIYRIYEYDTNYKGFNEQDDDDNYILNNYERIVEWENAGVSSSKINRPIKEKTDRLFDNLNDENKVANNILSEILLTMEDKFKNRDLISWEVEEGEV